MGRGQEREDVLLVIARVHQSAQDGRRAPQVGFEFGLGQAVSHNPPLIGGLKSCLAQPPVGSSWKSAEADSVCQPVRASMYRAGDLSLRNSVKRSVIASPIVFSIPANL